MAAPSIVGGHGQLLPDPGCAVVCAELVVLGTTAAAAATAGDGTTAASRVAPAPVTAVVVARTHGHVGIDGVKRLAVAGRASAFRVRREGTWEQY